MQQTVAARPARLWHIARPLGRLLAEFEASLAAGGEAASLAALDQIAAQGGVTAIQPRLPAHQATRPSRPQRGTAVDGRPCQCATPGPPPPGERGRPQRDLLHRPRRTTAARRCNAAACAALRDADRPLPLPVHDDITQYGDEAAATLITAAVGRGDTQAVERMTAAMLDTGRAAAVPRALWDEAEKIAGRPTPTGPVQSGDEPPGAAGRASA